jgi:hypothetical protein
LENDDVVAIETDSDVLCGILRVVGVCIAEAPPPPSTEVDVDVEAIIKADIDTPTKLNRLQELQRQHANVFSCKLHNELRDLYSTDNLWESLKQSDIILSRSTMDDYMLNILSGWELDKNPKKAIASLLRNARSGKECQFVKVACWLRVGDLYEQLW